MTTTTITTGVYLTVRQVADLLQIPMSTAYDMVNRGEIPGGVRIGKLIRVDGEAFAVWLETRRVAGLRSADV
jgi:excisionase family DNA binding protein